MWRGGGEKGGSGSHLGSFHGAAPTPFLAPAGAAADVYRFRVFGQATLVTGRDDSAFESGAQLD